MIVIADSGSTKTDWRCVADDGLILQSRTSGLNPYFTSDDALREALEQGPLQAFDASNITALHFYGSGLSSADAIDRYTKVLAQLFPSAELHLEHDLLGAARALCQHNPGVAVILGTGSNSCVFDGANIIDNIASTGYILGDEGSGADLGKRLVKAFLANELPADLHESFKKTYGVDRELILWRVYSQAQPNRFLASFVPFLLKNKRHPFVVKLIDQAFDELFNRYLVKYELAKSLPINACGSIAWYFLPFFRSKCEAYGMTLGTVIQEPIAALTHYHFNEA
jgi:N-acetylglucosamine kinase-like BadF-type ATPase